MTGHKSHFASIDTEADIFQCFIATGVALGDLVELNHGLYCSAKKASERWSIKHRINKLAGNKWPQVIDGFTDANIADRDWARFSNGSNHTAFGSAV